MKMNPEKCSILGPLVSRTVDGTWGKESVVQYSYNLRQDMENDYMGRAYRSHDLQDLLCTKAHHILLVVKLDHDWNSGPSICDCATVIYGLKGLLRVPFPLHACNSLMSNSYTLKTYRVGREFWWKREPGNGRQLVIVQAEVHHRLLSLNYQSGHTYSPSMERKKWVWSFRSILGTYWLALHMAIRCRQANHHVRNSGFGCDYSFSLAQ